MSSSQGNYSTPIMKAPSRFLQALLALAIKAGDNILEIYRSDLRVGQLTDGSPCTAASLVSHHFISEALQKLNGGFPVLSRLSPELGYEDRAQWETYWLINPLDEPLEDKQHLNEFTINIALIHQHKPVLGVVYVPSLKTCYFAAEGCGAFKKVAEAEPQAIYVCLRAPDSPRVVGSDLHSSPNMQVYLNQLGQHQFKPMLSSLKFCCVAEGEADLSLGIGLTAEWDTAAAHCILATAGGAVTDLQGNTLLYNAKPSLVNPFFLAYGDKTRDWSLPAEGVKGSPSPAPPPSTPLLKAVVALAMEAGKRVLEIYATDFRVGNNGDHSPLTAADLVSHHCLTEGLEAMQESYPVLSELSAVEVFAERKDWQTYWLVDPLNGTEEFIKRNGEFTVDVALIHCNKPVLGVVYAPALETCYFSAEGCGVYKSIGRVFPMEIHTRTRDLQRPVVVGSAEHSLGIDDFLNGLGEYEFKSIGGSLKFCKIAEAEADLYPCLTSTYEWETAAAQYITEAAGGLVIDLQGSPLVYNDKTTLIHPFFLALGDKSQEWAVHAMKMQTIQSLLAA